MSLRKRLSNELGSKYSFQKLLTNTEIENMLSVDGEHEERLIAVLTAGVVKLKLSVTFDGKLIEKVADVMVRDCSDGEWFSYNSFTVDIDLLSKRLEDSMLQLLDSEVRSYNLSYHQIDFETLSGKITTEHKRG